MKSCAPELGQSFRLVSAGGRKPSSSLSGLFFGFMSPWLQKIYQTAFFPHSHMAKGRFTRSSALYHVRTGRDAWSQRADSARASPRGHPSPGGARMLPSREVKACRPADVGNSGRQSTRPTCHSARQVCVEAKPRAPVAGGRIVDREDRLITALGLQACQSLALRSCGTRVSSAIFYVMEFWRPNFLGADFPTVLTATATAYFDA